MTTQEKPRRFKGFGNLRAPIMLLFVLAYCGARSTNISIAATVGLMIAFQSVVALAYERARLRELFAARWQAAAIGLGAAAGIYVIARLTLQLITSLTVGGLVGEGAVTLPDPLRMLLDIRAAAEALPPPLISLLGAALLAPSEELFWRGFIQGRLIDWVGRVLGIGLAVLLYGALWWVLLNPLAGAAAALTGLVCATLTQRERSLIPAISAHAALLLVGLWLWPLF